MFVAFSKSKKKLQNEEQIIVEGKILIKEAVQSHIKLNYLLFSHVDKIEDVVREMGTSHSHVNFIKVPQQDLRFYSVLMTCPGLIGIFDKPKIVKPKENPVPVTIICDNIREPNNLGAVIRLANALPVVKVLMPKGNADPWDVKAIRGSSGSIFHIPTESAVPWDYIEKWNAFDDSLVLIADNDVSKYRPSDVIDYDQLPDDLISGKQIYIIIGGESHGISNEARTFAVRRNWKVINIPIDHTVNSLNTSNALAIVLFELRRKLSKIQ